MVREKQVMDIFMKLKNQSEWKKVALLRIFGKLMKNRAFFVFMACPKSLTVSR
jgi:hypothetical protein